MTLSPDAVPRSGLFLSSREMQWSASAQDAFEQCKNDVNAHDSDNAPKNDIDDLSNKRDSDHAG